MTAFANGIINIVDLSRGLAHPASAEVTGVSDKMFWNAMLLVFSFGVLIVVMFIHQRLETGPQPQHPDKNRRLKRGIWMGIVGNVFGAAPLSVFIIGRLKGIL